MREAEAVAVINNWNVDVKKKYIGSRLKGPALNWHVERIRDFPNETFADWKQALINNFQHPADVEKLKHKLHNLMQTKEQRATHFISQIKSLYFSAYGERVPEGNAAAQAPRNVLRDEMLMKILMKGLQTKIKDAMWPRLPPNYTWEDATRAAVDAEKMIIARELNEVPTVNAVAYNFSENDSFSLNQQKRIENLEQSFKTFTINQAGHSQTGQPTDIAAITNQQFSNGNVQFNPYVQQHRYDNSSGYKSGNYSGNQQSKGRDENRGSHQSRGRSRSYDKNFKQNDQQRGPSYDKNKRGPSYDRNRRESYDRNQRGQSYDRNYRSTSYDRDNRRSDSGTRYNKPQNYNGNRSRSGSRGRNDYERANSPHPKEIICNRCENKGHIAAECKTKNPKKFQKTKN